jgi:adenosylcobinamide kinase/adenosylcobinamide-phosphate guanylyltransferase
MSKQLTLLLGGARSGKSRYAEQMVQVPSTAADAPTRVLFVATATACDEEMTRRIAAHRADRPAHWHTLEAPLQPGQAAREYLASQAAPFDWVLLDCMTLLANNVLFSLPENVSESDYQAALDSEVEQLTAAFQAGSASWVIISNEVGLGLVPPYPLGRMYRDVLGRANQRLAAAADTVLFLVAGLPLRVKG